MTRKVRLVGSITIERVCEKKIHNLFWLAGGVCVSFKKEKRITILI
jgi:hypothetical protein